MKKNMYRKFKVSRKEEEIINRIKAHTGYSISTILLEIFRAGMNNKDALLKYYGRGLTDELTKMYDKKY